MSPGIKFPPSLMYWIDFLLAMTEKEIKTRYKQAFFGFLWIFLNPLLQMLVMGFIFQFFVPVHIDNYFLFLFAGLLPWNFFSQSLTKSTPSFCYERNLIKKAKFPRETIVLSIVLSNFFHFLVSMVILIIFISLINLLNFQESINFLNQQLLIKLIILILSSLVLLFFTSFLSLFTASLQVKYRDINFIIQVVVTILFYATPIIYTLDLIPENFHFLFYLNPLTPIIQLFHYSLLNISLTINPYYLISFLIIIITFFIGLWTYQKENKDFDDWF